MSPAMAPVPTISRFFPKAIILTILVHGLVLLAVLQSPAPENEGGGGGAVLGRLSVSLGGTGDAAALVPSDADTIHPEPVPSVQTPIARTPAVQKPRATVAESIVRETVDVRSRVEPVRPVRNVNPVSGNAGDGRPVGVRSQGAQSLGEGVSSEIAGLGANSGASGNDRDAYLALIRARIEKNRLYPSAARRENAEGRVLMRVTIDGSGGVSRLELVAGSGSFHLDRAARRMIEKSAPFSAPPIAPFTTTIPIVFALR